jgi:uncharacterized alpha-E superfamily protein
MLSRVADNLYWMSRYMERAEHTARLIDVNLDLMLDRSPDVAEDYWKQLFTSLKVDLTDNQKLDSYNVTQSLTFDPSNPGSVVFCIAAARENARQVREQINSEMWEQVNRLYLDVQNSTIDEIWRIQPHQFFKTVKQECHLFQGISDSIMNHGEGWHFIQIGRFIERTHNLVTLLDVHLNGGHPIPSLSNTDKYMEWFGLLRSCTAFESYCKVHTADLVFEAISEFLLLNTEFPHSVHYSIRMLQRALNAIAESTVSQKSGRVHRLAGRLRATLDYDQIDEVLANGLHDYLASIIKQCDEIHEAIYHTYITYPIGERLIIM